MSHTRPQRKRSSESNCRPLLSGAQTGLTLKDTGGVIENVSIADNDVGINISGLSRVVVRNCWVADNAIGIQLVGTDAKIVQSAIVRNGIGLSLRGFSGEVSENIIVDNEQNIFSGFPLKLGLTTLSNSASATCRRTFHYAARPRRYPTPRQFGTCREADNIGMTKRRRGANMPGETAFGATDRPGDTLGRGLRRMIGENGK